jgi:hypothetical protein
MFRLLFFLLLDLKLLATTDSVNPNNLKRKLEGQHPELRTRPENSVITAVA